MSTQPQPSSARRIFLGRLGGMSGAALAIPTLLGGLTASPASAQGEASPSSAQSQHSAYLSLGPQEAACVEALVNAMCPADAITPNGVDCGLHVFIDRQLAGAWGRGDQLYRQGPWHPGKPQHGYQSPLTPELYFKTGIATLRQETQQRLGKAIELLEPKQVDALLQDVAAGRWDDPNHALATWFNDSFYPLFVQACFADPMYGGNQSKVFWRGIGFPGLPAVHGRNVIEYRGRAFAGADKPLSIEDFS